jgi:hypothetical protein
VKTGARFTWARSFASRSSPSATPNPCSGGPLLSARARVSRSTLSFGGWPLSHPRWQRGCSGSKSQPNMKDA